MTFLTPELLDTKTYGFEKLRYLLQSMGIQEGVIDPGDLKISQRAAGGAAQFVDYAPGRGFVKADTGTRNGMYHIVNDAVYTLAIPASHATLPRVDQVVVEVRDTSDMGSAADDALPRIIQGTATAGTTLDNAYDGSHGAAALPNNCIRLADVLVPAASTSVVNANIRDRRQWAQGARVRMRKNNAHFTTSGTGVGFVDSTLLQQRIECSGVPLKMRLRAIGSHNTAGGYIMYTPLKDGGVLPGTQATTGDRQLAQCYTPSAWMPLPAEWESVTPIVGTALIGLGAWTNTGTATIYGDGTLVSPIDFYVEEDLRASANNT